MSAQSMLAVILLWLAISVDASTASNVGDRARSRTINELGECLYLVLASHVQGPVSLQKLVEEFPVFTSTAGTLEEGCEILRDYGLDARVSSFEPTEIDGEFAVAIAVFDEQRFCVVSCPSPTDAAVFLPGESSPTHFSAFDLQRFGGEAIYIAMPENERGLGWVLPLTAFLLFLTCIGFWRRTVR